MVINKPQICAVITTDDLPAVKAVESQADLYEVRIDLIGEGWRRLVKHLGKPWIACNRRADEGGNWQGTETQRLEELRKATSLGAAIVDIELATPNLKKVIAAFKKMGVKCLVSHHDFQRTPAGARLKAIVQRQIAVGADICKVVTTAQTFADNLTVLQLISDFSGKKVVAFAMGSPGINSRILCPLAGGEFTYAAVAEGKESAAGQLTVPELAMIYGMLGYGR